MLADIIVEKKIIFKIKSIEKIAPVHKKQLISYLKLSGLKLGLLVNFSEELMKTDVTLFINGILGKTNSRKGTRLTKVK